MTRTVMLQMPEWMVRRLAVACCVPVSAFDDPDQLRLKAAILLALENELGHSYAEFREDMGRIVGDQFPLMKVDPSKSGRNQGGAE